MEETSLFAPDAAQSALRRHVEAIADLGRAALLGAPIPELLDDACVLLRDALEVDLVAVLEDTPHELVLRGGRGWADGAVGGAMSPRTASLAGYTLDTGEVVVLVDAANERRFELSPAFRKAGVTSGISVPVRGAKRPFGVLGVFTRSRRDFTSDECVFVRLVANTLAAAIESRRASELARERDGLLSELVAHSPDILIRFDRELRHLYISPAVERATGLPPEWFVGRTNRELGMPKELCDLFDRELLPVFDHGRTHRFEFELADPNGVIRLYETHAVPERGQSGSFESVVAFTRDRTEARSAELQLLRSQQRYRELFDSALDMIVLFDREGYIEDVNPAAERVLGHSREELVGKHYDVLIPAEERPKARERLARKLDGTAPTSAYEGVLQCKDGRILPVHASTQVLERDGQPAGVLAISRDISDQVAARAALVAGERRFRSAFDDAAVGMMLTLPDGAIERVNPAMARMLGYPQAALAEMTVFDITHPDDIAQARTSIEAMLRGSRDALVTDKRYIRGDGALVEAHVALSAVRDDDGAVQYFVAQVEDVTELKQTQRALEETQALHRMVIESSRDLITVLDLEGNLRLVSQSARGILGFEPEELTGRTIVDLIHPDDLHEVQSIVGRALEGGQAEATGTRVRAKDGSYRVLEGAAAAGFDRDGKPAFLVTSGRDVTDRLRLEERLRQTEKLEAIGKLAGGIAHDFNNLLTGINGYSDSALRQLAGGDNDVVRGYIAEIRRAGDHAAHLTRQLLAFSRQQDLRPEPLDLNEVVAGSETFLRRLLGEDVRVAVELGDGLPSAVADAGQLVQLVLNLSVNARDAMPRGGDLRIETRCEQLDDVRAATIDAPPGEYVVLVVSDTGEGIDPVTRERIFEPFFTTKEQGQGTGLGLSTVHGIVRQLGGAITCDSEVGHGTTFTIYLPGSAALPAAPTVERPAAGGSERVLLVEDEEIIRGVVELMLCELGYDVEVCGSPGDVLERIERGERFDVLLTDVVMPEMNGNELAAIVAERSPGVRVVYTSGYTGDIVLDRGVLAEGDAFLQKPFTFAELDEKIRSILAA
jgi:two-component system, cell cycle sensor histidine kinase and response regulator CckA